MSSAFKILPHYTYEDYEQWEGQWELIGGIPYAMSPQPVPKHQRISTNLCSEFRHALKSCNNYCKVYQPIDYKITEHTILQPDMLVVCGNITKKYLDFAPALVAELLSPSTALKDRHTKFEIYQSQGIRYFLIISCDTEVVEVFELLDGKYELKDSGHDIAFPFKFEDCNTAIDFKEIWD